MTASQLGFSNGAVTKDIYYAARKFGIKLCTSEIGPQPRLQYVEPQKDELLILQFMSANFATRAIEV